MTSIEDMVDEEARRLEDERARREGTQPMEVVNEEEEEIVIDDGTVVEDKSKADPLSLMGGDLAKKASQGAITQVGDVPLTRQARRQLERSSEAKDVLKRVKIKVEELREQLLKRERDTKTSGSGIAEFEKIFDDANQSIAVDLALLLNMKSSAKADDNSELRAECEQLRQNGSILQQQVDEGKRNGTILQSSLDEQTQLVLDLTQSMAQLKEQMRIRDERERKICDELEVNTIEGIKWRLKNGVAAVEGRAEAIKLMEDFLKEVNSESLTDVEEELINLRESKENSDQLIREALTEAEKKDDLIREIMNEVQVEDSESITGALQRFKTSMDLLRDRIKQLEEQVEQKNAELLSLDERLGRMTSERNEYGGKLNEKKKERLAEELGESVTLASDDRSGEQDGFAQRLAKLRGLPRHQEMPSPNQLSETTFGQPGTIERVKEKRTSGQDLLPFHMGMGDSGVSGNLGGMIPFSVDPSKLPPLKKFDGKPENWKMFRQGFLMRYEGMGSETARVVLEEMLTDNAKSEYKNLPEGYCNKSIRDCLSWLKDRCFGSSLYETVDVERKLSALTVKGRKVIEVCHDLEHLVSKLYPDEQQEEFKKRKMIILYQDTAEYPKLLKLLNKGKSYNEMKEYMQSAEYVQRRDYKDNKSDKVVKSGSPKFENSKGNGHSSGVSSDKSKCFKCGGMGHRKDNCPSGSNPKFADAKCFGCGGTGHTSRVCTSPQVVKFRENKEQLGKESTSQQMNAAAPAFIPTVPPSNSGGGTKNDVRNGNGWNRAGSGGGPPRTYSVKLMALKCDEVDSKSEEPRVSNLLSTENVEDVASIHVLNRLRSTMADGEREIEELVGSRPANQDEDDLSVKDVEDTTFFKKFRTVNGIIGGLPVDACLDTGAEVNLIDKRTVDKMSGVKLKKEVRFDIRDAQNMPVKTIGTITVDVNMSVGKACRVGFVVAERDLPDILLGGGALDAMGLELRMKEEQTEKAEEADQKSDEAVVLRARYIPPKQLGFVYVSGGRPGEGAKVLISDNDAVVEGTNDGSATVKVPVWNDTDRDMVVEKYEVIGIWCRVKGLDIGDDTKQRDREILRVNRCAKAGVDWSQIKENLEICRQGKLSQRVEEIIRARADVFAVEEDDLGRLNNMECNIKVEDGCKPIRQKERPVPFALKPALRALLDKMMNQGVIKRSNSPWLSPVVLVKKKDGSIRICIDFRRVNEVTKEDAFPLPYIETILQSLQGKRVFTVMDMSSGFWQLPLNEKSAEVTSFATMGELYQFTVLPFGLNISPAIFQRAMSDVLKEELSKEGKERVVHCYIDDVLIATETEEEHEKVLARVLDKLRDAGLLLNQKKCKIMMSEIDYLGHRLSSSGIHIDDKKIQAIMEYKRPETMSQLQQFMGMCGYHRRFVQSYAHIVQPINRLTVTTGRRLLWTDEANEAFESLKKAISSAPVLQQPDYAGAREGERPFILTTDASGVGIGAVLSQRSEDGVEKPLGFFSRGLRESERSLSVVDTEALAVFEAVIRWRHMLYNMRTVVRTDHQPLVTLLKRKHVASRLLRWATELQAYNLEIEHIKGKTNVVADALSRNPRQELPGENNGYSDSVGVVVNAVTRSKTVEDRLEKEKRRMSQEEAEDVENMKQWVNDQSRDPWVVSMIGKLREVDDGKRDVEEEVTIPASNKRTCLADWIVHRGILYLLGYDHEKKLYIPEGRREKFIADIHHSPLSGHLSTKKLVQKLSNEVFWGSMIQDVQKVVKKCERCLLANSQKRMIPPLQPLVSNAPMDVVGMDLIEMGRGVKGGKYILTVIDHFTRFADAFPVKDKKAETIAEVFMTQWICKGGRVPRTLVSDNGTELVNQVMNEIARRFQIERRLTLPYHSRANGLTERFNRTIVEIMRRIKMRDDEWEEALPYAVYAYNASPHGSTGETPAFLIYGQDEKLPNSQVPKSDPKYTVDMDVGDYKRRMSWLMDKTRSEVISRLEKERKKMKEIYDNKHRYNGNIKPVKGDRVYIRVELKTGDIRKMATQFEGPYRVVSTSNTTVTVVRGDEGLDSGREIDKRVVQWDRVRLVPRSAEQENEVDENEVAGVKRVAQVGEENHNDHSRIVVEKNTQLHPDYECHPCGKRELRSLLDDEVVRGGPLYTKRFATVREAAALLDLHFEEQKKLSHFEVDIELEERVCSKRVTSKSLKIAYRKGMCSHQAEAAKHVRLTGVKFEEEEESVGEAVSEVLSRGAGRISRKACVVLLPADSPVWKAKDVEEKYEFKKYEDEKEVKKVLETWETAQSLPRCVFLVLRSTFCEKAMNAIRKVVEELVKKRDVSFYVSGDVLPVKKDELREDAMKSQQAWLTQWRQEKPVVNLVVLSWFSGLILGKYAFAVLYEVAKKESKALFERAVEHIVDGVPFAFDGQEERRTLVAKRTHNKDRVVEDKDGTPEKKTYRDEDFESIKDKTCNYCGEKGHYARNCIDRKNKEECFNCHKMGHISRYCKEPKKFQKKD